jgi:hypothetical protein
MSWLSELSPIVIAWLMALSAVALHLFKRWGRGGENRYLLLAVAAFLLVALASNGLFGLLLSMLAIGFCIVIGRAVGAALGTRPTRGPASVAPTTSWWDWARGPLILFGWMSFFTLVYFVQSADSSGTSTEKPDLLTFALGLSAFAGSGVITCELFKLDIYESHSIAFLCICLMASALSMWSLAVTGPLSHFATGVLAVAYFACGYFVRLQLPRSLGPAHSTASAVIRVVFLLFVFLWLRNSTDEYLNPPTNSPSNLDFYEGIDSDLDRSVEEDR